MKLDVNIYLKKGRFLLSTEFRCFESALGIFGPSGSGKSTLFRALAGLEKPNGGYIKIGGETLFDSDRKIFVPPHERGIGLVFQDARLFPHWSVEQNLRAGEKPDPTHDLIGYSYDDIVELLEINRLTGRSVEQLSGGEKQRVALGRALLSRPRLLLMDEPVTGLDAALKAQILPFLAEVHRALKVPTILISHDLSEILQLTNHLMLMRNGSSVGIGPLARLVQSAKTLQELKGTELTNVLYARVAKHDAGKGVTLLQPIENDAAPQIEMELNEHLFPGSEIVIGMDANQIALAPQRIDAISMRNQFPAVVDEITHAPDRSLCSLKSAVGPLFVEITPGTEADMGLKEGETVWALFKSRAIKQIGQPV